MRVMPVQLEPSELPGSLKHLHCVLLTDSGAFGRLVESLDEIAETTRQARDTAASALSRRKFVAMTVTGTMLGASWLSGRLLTDLHLDERDMIPHYHNLDRSRRIFFPTTAIDVVPPSSHHRIQKTILLSGGAETYGHEYNVLMRLKEYLPAQSYQLVDNRWEPEPGHSLVCLGGGEANQLTNELVGDLTTPKFFVGNEREKVQLQYAVKAIGRDRVWHLQYGDMYPGRNSAIAACDGSPLALPKTDAKQRTLTEDYLLVTRMPGRGPGTTVTIFSGLHGPGTRAAELLLSNLPAPQVDFLVRRLNWKGTGPVPWFQAVFRAWDFEEIGESWVPRQIECVRDSCPPIPLSHR
jgi:hypothetical protein